MRVWTAWRCFENIFGALGIGAHFPSRASQRSHPVTYFWKHGSVLIYYHPVAYWHFTRFSLKIKCTYFHIFILSLWAQSNPRLLQTDKLGLKKRPYCIQYYIPYQEVIEYLLSVVPFWGINNWNRLCLYLDCLDISWNPPLSAILFFYKIGGLELSINSSLSVSEALARLWLFYEISYKGSGKRGTSNEKLLRKKGIGFWMHWENFSSNAKLKYWRAELRMEPGKNFDYWDNVSSMVKSHLEGAKRPTENFFWLRHTRLLLFW